MVNILVPTDFSDLSKIAVEYGIKIVNKLGGTLTLIHVVNIVRPTTATIRMQLKAFQKDLMKT